MTSRQAGEEGQHRWHQSHHETRRKYSESNATSEEYCCNDLPKLPVQVLSVFLMIHLDYQFYYILLTSSSTGSLL